MMKKCIEQNRKTAIYGMRVLAAFMLFVVVGNFSVVIGSAESGTVIFGQDDTKSYIFSASGPQGALLPNFTRIHFDNSAYNGIESLRINWPAAYAYSFESTTFSIVDGAIGGEGVVWYDRNTSNITYVFASGTKVTANKIALSFAKNIFLNVSSGGNVVNVDSLSASAPAGIGHSLNDINVIRGGGYTAQVILSTSAGYDVSYFGKFFRLNVTKGDIPLMVYINGSSSVYSQETTYNTINITEAVFEYLDGIILSFKMVTGASKTTVVNATNCPNCIELPPPELRVYPASGANIYTDKASYIVGDNIDVEWFIADNPYNNLLSSCEFEVNGEPIMQDVAKHDNYTIIQPGPGIKKLDITCGVFSNTIAGTKSVQVIAEGQSKIIIPINSSSGSRQNLTFQYGFSSGVYAANSLAIFYLDGGNWIQENTYYTSTFCAGTCVSMTSYPANITFLEEGFYRLDLRAHGRGVVASATTTASFTQKKCTVCFTVPMVTTSKAVYFMREGADVYYQADSTNYSDYKLYIELYNYDKLVVSDKRFIDTESATRVFFLTDKKQLSGEFLAFAGNNSWQLTAYHPGNDTLYKIIAFKNITITTTNTAGYAISVSKDPICNKNDYTDIQITIPSATAVLFYEPGGKIVTLNLSESRTLRWSGERRTGYYGIQILNPAGNLEVQSSVTVISCDATAPPTIPGQPGQPGSSGAQTMNNLMTFISMPAFWGILLFIVCVIGVAWKAPAATGMVALIVSNLEAIVGLWSPFTIYVFIVTWIIAAIFFTIGRKTTTGGE